jgi:hypothetical protein
MKEELRQITRAKTRYLSTALFAVVGVLLCILGFGSVTVAATYSDSAHGNDSYGVSRSGTECPTDPCPQGDCTHCHDTFDDAVCGNPLMLFAGIFVTIGNQFCTQCHSAVVDYQPITTNYPYSYTFGGYPDPYYGHIKKQITDDHSTPDYCGSRHNMKRIRNYVKDDENGWGFGADPSPCVACHNPHMAQRNYPPAITEGKLNTAVRRPSHYNSTAPADSLWGDDADERMSYYAASVEGEYQAPYYGDTSGTQFEPSGNDSPSDGSDLPDYVTFCLDCHQYEQFDPDNNDRTIKAIDYANERHGAYPSNTCSPTAGVQEGTVRAPYVDSENSNYVLSCLDCHEPHGAKKRQHLIRRMINGQEVELDSKDSFGNCYDSIAVICEKCHEFPEYNNHLDWGGCVSGNCHGSGVSGSYHGAQFGYPHFGPDCEGGPSF